MHNICTLAQLTKLTGRRQYSKWISWCLAMFKPASHNQKNIRDKGLEWLPRLCTQTPKSHFGGGAPRAFCGSWVGLREFVMVHHHPSPRFTHPKVHQTGWFYALWWDTKMKTTLQQHLVLTMSFSFPRQVLEMTSCTNETPFALPVAQIDHGHW